MATLQLVIGLKCFLSLEGNNIDESAVPSLVRDCDSKNLSQTYGVVCICDTINFMECRSYGLTLGRCKVENSSAVAVAAAAAAAAAAANTTILQTSTGEEEKRVSQSFFKPCV